MPSFSLRKKIHQKDFEIKGRLSEIENYSLKIPSKIPDQMQKCYLESGCVA